MKYEVMCVLSPKLTDDERKTEIDWIKTTLEEQKCTVQSLEDQGRKRMAYRVKKENEGHYVLVRCEGPGEAIKTLDRHFRIRERILRFMFVRCDKVIEKIPSEKV